MDLSVLVPARNEQYLQQTIDSVLAASEADIEVVVVLDGYWPAEPIPDNPRVVLIHHTEARGQRQSINEAARIARGKHLMKLDAHCSVGQGFDRILIEAHQPGWTQVPRMYNLDVEKWEPKLNKRTDYMYVGCAEGRLLRPEYYKRQPDTDLDLDETMACMGPGWFLSAEDFWRQGGCDEGHGSWGQQGVEVALKAWLSGGALMVNKRTWFSHWFRGGGGPGFPYPISGREVEAAREYSRNLWLNNAWPGQVRTLEWLVRKFEPPGWEGFEFPDALLPERMVPTTLPGQVLDQDTLNARFYGHIHKERHHPTWRGVPVIKMPTDLQLYHQVIWQNRPKWIIETGTKYGGSSLFLQDQLDLVGEGGKVITIDIKPDVAERDPRIEYVVGSSVDRGLIARLKAQVGDDPVMVVLDSAHARKHVKWELYLYAPLVTPGQYLVIEDCHRPDQRLFGPGEARDWFLSSTREGRQFEQTHLDREFLVGFCRGGFLRRKA